MPLCIRKIPVSKIGKSALQTEMHRDFDRQEKGER